MFKFKSIKSALITSVVSLFLCVAMLVGTTFAWFTDSVTSANNVIKSGNLDVQLWEHTAEGSFEITNESDPLFGRIDSENANANSADTLWEPGKTQTVYLSIKNAGSLDLKYMVVIEVTNITKNLNEALVYYITPDAEYGSVTKASLLADTNNWALGTKVDAGINFTASSDVVLKSGDEHFFALSVHMDELAGNEYQDGNITFNIKVLAGQLASEEDSFDNQYDADATYPGGFGGASVVPGEGAYIVVYDEEREKIGTVLVPADAVADGNAKVAAGIVPSTYVPNITVAAGSEVETIDIDVSNIKENNTAKIEVQYFIGEGYDPDTVKVYHYDGLLADGDYAYNQESGYVVIRSTDFSPFTIEYDADSHYEDNTNLPEGIPMASVIQSYQYENVELPWENLGGFYPTEGLDSQLEAAYTFSCIETPEEAAVNPYAQWHCDFVVVLDRDLGENQIFLGGNYGSFGWIGFHNGDLTLEANTEIPLLGSVTQNPWTYEMVADFVGTFICGVGDVNDALSGATFTVMLRLTNPENEAEFYNVATIQHTFQ